MLQIALPRLIPVLTLQPMVAAADGPAAGDGDDSVADHADDELAADSLTSSRLSIFIDSRPTKLKVVICSLETMRPTVDNWMDQFKELVASFASEAWALPAGVLPSRVNCGVLMREFELTRAQWTTGTSGVAPAIAHGPRGPRGPRPSPPGHHHACTARQQNERRQRRVVPEQLYGERQGVLACQCA